MATKVPDLPGSSDSPAPKPVTRGPVDLKGLSLEDLLDLRARIEPLLPATSLQDIDLQRELVLQVSVLQQLQTSTHGDDTVAPNQMAQVSNSLSSALANLVRVQNNVYTSERLKKIEVILIQALNNLPLQAQEEFFAAYETALEDLR